MKRDPAARKITVTLEIRMQDIYDALDKVGLPKTAGNVVRLVNFLELEASNWTNTALVEWVEGHMESRGAV